MFNEAFKQIAVELSHAKGSVQKAARELGIDSIAPANRPDHQMAAKSQKPWSVCNCSYRVERGWAPCGQTLAVVDQAGRAHLSSIAAIAPNGRVYLGGKIGRLRGKI